MRLAYFQHVIGYIGVSLKVRVYVYSVSAHLTLVTVCIARWFFFGCLVVVWLSWIRFRCESILLGGVPSLRFVVCRVSGLCVSLFVVHLQVNFADFVVCVIFAMCLSVFLFLCSYDAHSICFVSISMSCVSWILYPVSWIALNCLYMLTVHGAE
jgi:hypothetical protein